MEHHLARSAALVTVVVGAVLSGCTSPVDASTAPATLASAPSLTTTTSPSPSPTADPAVAEAKALVLEAYRGYWEAKVASFADPSRNQDPNLAHFAIDTALTDAESAIAEMRSAGIETPGQPELAPVVADVSLVDPQTATVADCVDSTDWQAVFTSSGESAVAPGQELRVSATATATFYDGRWVIDTYRVERDRPC